MSNDENSLTQEINELIGRAKRHVQTVLDMAPADIITEIEELAEDVKAMIEILEEVKEENSDAI